ncbi:hypothetical protein XBKB1_700022 [Xenorhabdus bovienii str. kraussei Becker Underwood]|uniref:Uncharacterized protein n=1 Tax=Xenorhabdus bovienii str. kraussei Becker Underwood TaxID=1398204 RepID=A0A077Q0B9_XENBV|nr:hypothetical protein XBKB1_700022 [Xenorhabdus bovienii str. kraussei Becker Underwood]
MEIYPVKVKWRLHVTYNEKSILIDHLSDKHDNRARQNGKTRTD